MNLCLSDDPLAELEREGTRQRAAEIRRRAMSNPVANPICQVCEFGYPPITHLHHIHPVAQTNGASDDYVWLCPNCHAMVHEILRCYYNKGATNLEMRLSHLDYWLWEVCDRDVANKLEDIAKRSLER